MGETANEIPRLREARDHQVGRAVPSAGQAHAGETRHCPGDLLPLVRSLPIWRSRGAGRSPFTAKPGVEPHPRCDEGEDCQAGPGRADFVSAASVYRLLKAHDLIASPAFIVIKAADEFKDKTTAPNQLWQTDFTYLKVIGWGWFY